jgi:pyruvate dehydrogenase E2 component (dihydrolipoamide acetyltransferase)
MKDFVLPSLGADMDEGMLEAWLVAPGDTVTRGQVIAEVETDKGIIEVEVWEDAVIDELLVEPSGVRLRVGTPIARLRSPGEVSVSGNGSPGATTARMEPQGAEVRPAEVREPGGPEREPTSHTMPPVRHLAHQLGVNLAQVAASSPDGMVTRDDVRRAATELVPAVEREIMRSHRPRLSPRARKLAIEGGIDPGVVAATRPDGLIVAADVEASRGVVPEPSPADPLEKVKAMRRAIARSMERSKREIPHYYLGHRIDMAASMEWVDKANADRPVTRRILPAALLIKATALALSEYPDLNGHWIEGAFVPSRSVHLGVAVSLRGGGLVAPAIHDADTLDLDQMMSALADLVARARAGRLKGSEMSDPTSTVTNLGDRGVASVFPVIIPPQVSIVGFGSITEEPVAVDGAVVVHPVMQASLAADHRVTDGHTGGLLLLAIERLLQEPEKL